MTKLAALLSERNTQLYGACGDSSLALSRLPLSRTLGEEYRDFDSLRRYLEKVLAKQAPGTFKNQASSQLIERLIENKLITETATQQYKYTNNNTRSYLAGGWLEELIYCAMLESGADEVLYQQKLEWTVGDVTGKNEIDVIARKGNILSFTSCKTCNWHYKGNSADTNKLNNFLREADYWDTHFANNHGRAVLVVTQDLIDEENNTLRSPTIFARAEIINVDLISLDFFKWHTLVEKLKRHWE